jgi:hypothetical protein
MYTILILDDYEDAGIVIADDTGQILRQLRLPNKKYKWAFLLVSERNSRWKPLIRLTGGNAELTTKEIMEALMEEIT